MSIDDVSDYDDVSDDEIPAVVNAVDESDEEDDTTRTVDRNIQQNRTRKHILKDLEDTMDETNYDRLPPQEPKTFLWKAKDPRKNKDYKWETVFNVEGRTGRENVIPNRPGPRVRARQAESLTDLFSGYITEEMVILVRDCTNAKISKIKETKPEISESDKHTYLKETTNEEIRAFFGLLFIRGALKQNLRSTNKLFHHKSSNSCFKATMSLNRFKFLVATMQFDNSEDRQE